MKADIMNGPRQGTYRGPWVSRRYGGEVLRNLANTVVAYEKRQ